MDNTKELLGCLQPVQSSMFTKAGYCPDYWTLVFVFKSTGEVRAYKNVAPEVADSALNAKSLGQWWNQMVRGKPEWEGEVIGAEPPEPGTKAEKPAESLSVIDSDIKLVEPGWNGKTIDPLPSEGVTAEDAGLEPTTWPVYGGIGRGQTTIPAPQSGVIFQELPPTPKMEFSGWREPPPVETSLSKQTQGEILPAWTAPETAAEALELMSERDSEIRAILQQNKVTGEQALTVKITTPELRIEASETLNRLVAKKNTTTAALDPFRSVLYEAYSEAGAKVKAGVEPLDVGIAHVKKQILSWDQEQERIRQQELRKAREAAEAEARRLQDAEEQRLRLAEVADALDRGDEKEAQTLFDTPIEVPKPFVQPQYIPPAAPKVEGQSTSTAWKVDRESVESDETGAAYVASITQLLKAVKNGTFAVEQAAQLLLWDFSAADKLAGAMMAAFNVPGLTAAPKSTLRVGAGRKKK